MNHDDEDEKKKEEFQLKQPTGRFIRPRKQDFSPPDPEELEHPTQKIILFPSEVSQALPDAPPIDAAQMKPPIIFTAPLPKIDDLPEDFLDEEELIDHNPPVQPPDFSQYLQGDQVDVEYPNEQKKIAQFLKELEAKADNYADQMFTDSETEDTYEIERIERLIPGTDHEEGRRSLPPSRKKVKKKRKKNLPPDVEPYQLGRKLQKPLDSMKKRRLFLIFFLLLTSSLTFFPDTLIDSVPWLQEAPQQMLVLGVALLIGMCLCWDCLLAGFLRGMQLQVGTDTLSLFAAIFTGLDCFIQGTSQNPRGQLPYVTLLLLQFSLLLYGEEEKRKAHYRSCQVATTLETPYLITLEPRTWNAKPAFTKSCDVPTGFTSQLQQDDGMQEMFHYTAPVFLLGSFIAALYLTENTEDFVWAFSALLLASNPLGASFLYGRAANKVSNRLKLLRCTLAGWQGVAKLGKQCIVSDTDLFPAGNVEISGARILGNFNERKVLAYTSAMLQEGDYGCSRLFHEMMVRRNLFPPKVREAAYHEGGGISALIGPDSVMVGSADFMELMQIKIPEGMFMPNTIFVSINSRLAGIFSLEYNLPYVVSQSLESLLNEGIMPVLATRDFSITPEMLYHRFNVPTDKMAFPSVTRRRELSSSARPQDGILTAMLVREGVESVADCVIAARRLRRAIYMGIGFSLLASTLGFLLVAFLVNSQAYNSLGASNLMFFLCFWLPPFMVLTDLPHRF